LSPEGSFQESTEPCGAAVSGARGRAGATLLDTGAPGGPANPEVKLCVGGIVATGATSGGTWEAGGGAGCGRAAPALGTMGGSMKGVESSDEVSAAAEALPRVMLLSDFSGSACAAMFGCAAAWLSAEPASGSLPPPPGPRPNKASSESPPPPPDPNSGISASTRPPTSRPKLLLPALDGWPSE